MRRRKTSSLDEAQTFLQQDGEREGLRRLFINSYKGTGIFTTKPFSKGEFLMEYKGELISAAEGDKRLHGPGIGSFLFFFRHKGLSLCIDGTLAEGLGRYVNDSIKPNSKMKLLEVKGTPRLALFALRPLKEKEEIVYDYGEPNVYWRKDKSRREIYQCPDDVEKLSDEVGAFQVHANDVPADDVPADKVPADDVPAGDVLAGDVPAGDMPADKMPADDVHPDEVPADDVPADDVPADKVPADDVPADDVPADDVPADDVPPDKVPADDVHPDEVPADDVPAVDVPPDKVPADDVPADDMPADDMPADDVLADDVPAYDVPAGDVPAGDVPAGDMPAGDVPADEVPAGDVPAGDVPADDVPAEEDIKNDKDFVEDSDSGDSYIYPILTGLSAEAAGDKHDHEGFGNDKGNITDDQSDGTAEEDTKNFIFDKKNKNLFMPALKHCHVTEKGKKKKNTRVWNKEHACFFCGKYSQNISKHLRTHRNTVEIKAILDMEANKTLDKKRVKTDVGFQLDLLRHKGDHKNNISVLEGGEGHLIVARRQSQKKFDIDQYSPCPYCLLWLKEDDMYKHKVYRCIFKSPVGNQSNGRLFNQGRILKGDVKPSPFSVVTEVFPSMTRDSITRTVQTDSLIIELGEEWLRKASRNKLRRKNYASSHMRRAARVLHLCRIVSAQDHPEDPAVFYMGFLVPSYFDTVVTAAVKAAGMESIDETAAHPSVAIKFGHDLVRMAETKEAMAIKSGDAAMRSDASDFLTLISKEWPSKVAITSQRIAEERRYSKKIVLPPADDLRKLSQYLQAQLAQLSESFYSTSWDVYQRAVKIVQARLATYNKRRPGELEALTLVSYKNRYTSSDVIQQDVLDDLSTLEKTLHDTHDLVTVRGKRGASVPVLIPPDLQAAIQYISSEKVRNSPEIMLKEESSQYLFANSGRSVFRVCDSMRELRNECNIDCELIGSPDLLTCTLLRKYMATATQMLSVNDQELHWIVKHLGHSLTVHDQYYRVMSSTLERAKIAKLLVLADQGMLGKYKGQSLEQLNFDEIQLPSENPVIPFADTKLEESQSEEMLDDSDTSDDDSLGSEGKNKVPVQRRSEKLIWSKAETNEVEEYFSEMIQDLKAPGKAESLAYLEFSKYTTNRKRTWEDVKNKVNASVQREKRQRH